MANRKIYISYDREADVVYFSFGKPVKAEGEEVQDGVFARYSPSSHDLVGLTITNFSRKFGSEPKEIAVRATN